MNYHYFHISGEGDKTETEITQFARGQQNVKYTL